MTEPNYRRILITIEQASGPGLDALGPAAALAARVRGELIGLFVEETALYRLAGQAAFSTVTRSRRALDQATLETASRVQVAAARKALVRAAEKAQVQSRFLLRQGRLSAEVLQCQGEADLLVVGWSAGAAGVVTRSGRPGPLARVLLDQAALSVLVLHPKTGLTKGPVMVVYDGRPDSERALISAAMLHDRRSGMPLEVLLAADGRARLNKREGAAGDILKSLGVEARMVELEHPTIERICKTARLAHAALLVTSADNRALKGVAPGQLLDHLESSLLLVR